jgi:L,D-transpeptidase catalytic domain
VPGESVKVTPPPSDTHKVGDQEETMLATRDRRSPIRRIALLTLGVLGWLVLLAVPSFGSDDVGLVDTDTGIWYLRDGTNGSTTSFYYGNPHDVPFTGDWDCDGVATPGLYRQADGFVYLRQSNTQGIADRTFFFGNPGDVPIAGDFDGDGCDTVSIYRPSERRIYIINELGADGAGLGAADFSYTFGNRGDRPVVGDADGDGRDTVSMFRPSTDELFINDTLTPVSSPAVTVAPDTTPLLGAWPDAGGVATFGTGGAVYTVPDEAPFEYGKPSMTPISGLFGDLPGLSDPPPRPPPYPDVGSGKRIIYSNSEQRVWLIDEHDVLVDTYPVSGRKGIPYFGTYTVFSKSVNARAPYGGITMKHMVRFVRPGTWGNQWSYGFHSIPRYSNGQPMQTEDELGTFRSGGCVRQADYKAAALYAWADIGTVVHAIP